jgi:polysaccharide biosynthesis/export protein
MFEPGKDTQNVPFKPASTYLVIHKHDHIQMQIFMNGGEAIVDRVAQPAAGAQQPIESTPTYVVDSIGSVNLPLVGKINLEGKTIEEAETILIKAYTEFYKNPYVKLSLVSKRVIVLGAFGNKIVPLRYDNMKLTEILALSGGGLQDIPKFGNIRILRDEKFFIADLSKLEGFANNDIIVQPDDVIYVEPVRKPIRETLRDYVPALSILVSLSTLIILLESN